MQDLLSIVFWPVLIGGSVTFLVAMLLVQTQHWHGHLTMDSTFDVQKVLNESTPRVGGIAIADGALVGLTLARPSVQSLLWPLLLAGSCAFVFGLVEDITKQVSIRTRLLAIMWFAALIPAVIAISSPTHATTLAVGFVSCAMLYFAVYALLTQFRWCFAPATCVENLLIFTSSSLPKTKQPKNYAKFFI